ncbi:hypothetical protein PAECIP111891_00477 [Paenibacillus allorhizoplanae]|uniref:Transposase n=1 Tax=Paenibacillus allorhizoplanae TaxID=2905648 RepID=A0ABN8FV79_9BACL|nr:hypothetical protein PAECIP111891_00477 [Paenibacillus allorhizoplanae]
MVKEYILKSNKGVKQLDVLNSFVAFFVYFRLEVYCSIALATMARSTISTLPS